MKKLVRLAAMVAALALAFGFASCKNETDDSGSSPSPAPDSVSSPSESPGGTAGTPLTLEATGNGTIRVYDPKDGMQFSLNGGAKTAVTSSDITVSAGDKVQFYGNGTSITNYSGTKIRGGTAQVKVYGNIMSLLDEQNFATVTTLTTVYVFHRLFYHNTTLTDASGLLLPATTLSYHCYEGMFDGCTNLSTAPVLPAPTLVEDCYNNMFCGCSQLTYIKCLATSIAADNCTLGWVTGVVSSGTFVRPASMQSAWEQKSENYGIPTGWTVEDAN